jgi:hypothetical protein
MYFVKRFYKINLYNKAFFYGSQQEEKLELADAYRQSCICIAPCDIFIALLNENFL